MKKYATHFKRGLALAGVVLVILLCALVFATLFQARAQPGQEAFAPPHLGTAGSFAVLGGSTVTNTGPTRVNGNLGVSPGSAVTGFPPGIVHGAMHKADAVALQAQKDVTIAYVNAAGQACNHHLTGQDLGGKSLIAGVYCFSSSAQLTGQLTLDGTGVFIFQIGSKLTTAHAASVLLIHGAQPCTVFWQVGSSATMGTNTHFAGNILALTSIEAQTGAKFNGGLYARNGAVTLDTNTTFHARCAGGSTPVPTKTPTATPTPETGLGLLPDTGNNPEK